MKFPKIKGMHRILRGTLAASALLSPLITPDYLAKAGVHPPAANEDCSGCEAISFISHFGTGAFDCVKVDASDQIRYDGYCYEDFSTDPSQCLVSEPCFIYTTFTYTIPGNCNFWLTNNAGTVIYAGPGQSYSFDLYHSECNGDPTHAHFDIRDNNFNWVTTTGAFVVCYGCYFQ